MLLCMGVAILNRVMQKKVPDRNRAVLQALAFLQVLFLFVWEAGSHVNIQAPCSVSAASNEHLAKFQWSSSQPWQCIPESLGLRFCICCISCTAA